MTKKRDDCEFGHTCKNLSSSIYPMTMKFLPHPHRYQVMILISYADICRPFIISNIFFIKKIRRQKRCYCQGLNVKRTHSKTLHYCTLEI